MASDVKLTRKVFGKNMQATKGGYHRVTKGDLLDMIREQVEIGHTVVITKAAKGKGFEAVVLTDRTDEGEQSVMEYLDKFVDAHGADPKDPIMALRYALGANHCCIEEVWHGEGYHEGDFDKNYTEGGEDE